MDNVVVVLGSKSIDGKGSCWLRSLIIFLI